MTDSKPPAARNRAPTPDRESRLPLNGDEADLFRRHFSLLVRQVQRDASVPEAVAEDCASLAFLQLCRTQPDRTVNVAGWLRVVARHEVRLAPARA